MQQSAIYKIKKYTQIIPSDVKRKDSTERDRLISEYAPLVKTIAGRLCLRLPSHISHDDLSSAGIMGLLDAIEKFDPEKGVAFKSYAEFRIRGAMLDELRSMDWVPRSVRKNTKILEDVYSKVEKMKMRPARDEEVAYEMGIDMEAFHQKLDEARGISIISQEMIGSLIPQNESNNLYPMNSGSMEVDPLVSLSLSEVRDVIAQAIENLPKNERMVVTLYYYEELTMKEIGEVMDYTESRISQLHTRAIIRLRNSLKAYFDTEN